MHIPRLDNHHYHHMSDSYQSFGRSQSFEAPRSTDDYSAYPQHPENLLDDTWSSDPMFSSTQNATQFSDLTVDRPVWGTSPMNQFSSGQHLNNTSVNPSFYPSSSFLGNQSVWTSTSSQGMQSTSNYLPYASGGLDFDGYNSMPYSRAPLLISPNPTPAPLSNTPYQQRRQMSPHMNPLPPSPPTPQSHGGLSPSPGADSLRSIAAQGSEENKNKPLYSHKEQLQFFRDALSLPYGPPAGPFVPQIMYKPHTNSDRRRYVEEVDLEAPIHFWVDSPHECGISLSDALHSRVRRLLNRDETVFEGRGPSVSIRLEWPGYRQWSRQIPTKDFRSPPGPITRAKLAKNVAKCVQRFITERQGHTLEEDTDSRWRVGPNHIQLEDLILVSIHHVSMGSWQPQLRLRRPFSTA